MAIPLLSYVALRVATASPVVSGPPANQSLMALGFVLFIGSVALGLGLIVAGAVLLLLRGVEECREARRDRSIHR